MMRKRGGFSFVSILLQLVFIFTVVLLADNGVDAKKKKNNSPGGGM